MANAPFEKGLFEVADGVFAYLQPDGSYGWSNAGLIRGAGRSLLVDTLFDLRLTAEMLDVMKPVTATSPIATVVNTHANGDHCFGNQLVASDRVEIIASAATAEEMLELPPKVVADMLRTELPAPLGEFVKRVFGPFRFDDIDLVGPTRTFSGELRVAVGGRAVDLVEVGPAHTAGDVFAWLPDARVVFAGDILFVGGTPVMWSGPIERWIAACERIISLDPAVVVPGHGPLTDVQGVEAVAAYLRLVAAGCRARFDAGMSAQEAALDLDREIDGTPYGEWGDRERLVATVDNVYRALDPSRPPTPVVELFRRMAAYRRSDSR